MIWNARWALLGWRDGDHLSQYHIWGPGGAAIGESVAAKGRRSGHPGVEDAYPESAVVDPGAELELEIDGVGELRSRAE